MNRIFSLFFTFFCLTIYAQYKIVKVNGDTILAKVLEIGTNAISYKKASVPNGPTYSDLKTDVALIIFSNGKIEYFARNPAQNQGSQPQTTPENTDKQNTKNKIEVWNGTYSINGQSARRKDVDRLLSKSNNPAITIPLKAAKATKTAQTIIKIVSFPTTIGGSVGSLVTGVNLINDVRRGRDNTHTYVSFFSSFLTTISLPITNKILKKKSDKMYKKLIDAYNITN
jgi:hypothetical protein